MRRAIAIVIAFCALVASAVGALMMSAAWDDNPQGAIYELAVDGTRTVDWGYWGLIGLSWFVLVFVPLSLVGSGVIALSYYLDKKRSAGQIEIAADRPSARR